MFILVPLVNRLMLPDEKESVYVDPARLEEASVPASDDEKRPAARLENSRLLAWLIAAGGLAYMFDYYVVARRRPEPQCHQLQLPDPGHPAARHAAPPAGQPGRSHQGEARAS